jgi:hypothetical protein
LIEMCIIKTHFTFRMSHLCPDCHKPWPDYRRICLCTLGRYPEPVERKILSPDELIPDPTSGSVARLLLYIFNMRHELGQTKNCCSFCSSLMISQLRYGHDGERYWHKIYCKPCYLREQFGYRGNVTP